jgi:hypothetical protein
LVRERLRVQSSLAAPLKPFENIGLFDVIYDVWAQVSAVSIWGKSGDMRF